MCSFWILASLSFNYSVLVCLYIATLLISSSGDVELNPGPSMNPKSVNSSFDSYATLINSGLSIMNVNTQCLKLKLDILTVEAQPYDVLVLLKHGCQVMFQKKMSKSQTLRNRFFTKETTVLAVVSLNISETLACHSTE